MSRRGLLLAACLLGTIAACDDLEREPREVDRSYRPTVDGRWASGPWGTQQGLTHEDHHIVDPEEDGLIEIAPDERITLLHGLCIEPDGLCDAEDDPRRRPPAVIQAYVGFSAEGGYLMPATGNAVEIWGVNKDSIEIRNRSGGSFFYRFVLF